MILICLMTQILTSKSARSDNSITKHYQNAINVHKTVNFALQNLLVLNARASTIKLLLNNKESILAKFATTDVTNALKELTLTVIFADTKN